MIRAPHDIQTARADAYRPATPAVLVARGLRKSFGRRRVLVDASLDLYPGEIAVLIGANGSGKTLLLDILTGWIPADGGSVEQAHSGGTATTGFPVSMGRKLLRHFTNLAQERIARRGLVRAWQHTRLFQSLTVRDNLRSAVPQQSGEKLLHVLLRPRAVAEEEANLARAAEARLADFGLRQQMLVEGARLSLGQAKKTEMLRAVHAGTQVLLLDEPLGGLDGHGVREVLGLVRQLAERGIAVVLVEHVQNLAAVLEIATKVWMLGDGKIQVVDPRDVAGQLQPAANSWPWTSDRWELVSERILGGGATLSRFRRRGSPPTERPLLEVCNLVIRRGGRIALGGHSAEHGRFAGTSFSIHAGELAILKAPNAWGKTTLLEAIAGLVPIEEGDVVLAGKAVHAASPAELRRRGVVFVQAERVGFPDLTVTEVLRLAGAGPVPSALAHIAAARSGTLSGGELQQLYFQAGVGASPRECVLLDEPFNGLDGEAVLRIQRSVEDLAERGACLVAIPAPVESVGALESMVLDHTSLGDLDQ